MEVFTYHFAISQLMYSFFGCFQVWSFLCQISDLDIFDFSFLSFVKNQD